MSTMSPREAPIATWPRYAAYRDSGVAWLGEVPAHWRLAKLKQVAVLKSGEAITTEDIMDVGPYPVYGGNGLRGYCPSYTHEGQYPLIGRQGALCGNINYAMGRFWASEHAVVVTPRTPVAVFWLGELLRAMNLNQYSVSAAQPGLAVDRIRELFIPLPPLPEQRAIADFLDRKTAAIDAVIRQKERLVGLLQEKRQALITCAVTKGLDPTVPMKDSGIDWLGEVPAHWEVLPLRRRWRIVDCKHRTAEYVLDGIPIVSTTEVTPGRLNLAGARMTTERDYADLIAGRRPRRGDIIYSRNASVGSAAYVDTDERFCMGQDVVLIKSGQQDQLYLAYQLNSSVSLDQLGAFLIGSTFKRINVRQIQDLLVLVPPCEEQATIARFLDEASGRLEACAKTISQQIAKLREYRQALISAAVTGKIDVQESAEDHA